jgi:hypothetical protein
MASNAPQAWTTFIVERKRRLSPLEDLFAGKGNPSDDQVMRATEWRRRMNTMLLEDGGD